MPMDADLYRQKHYQAGQVFTPSSPINSNDLFAGRQQQVTSLIDAINQVGQHAALYGERGVGKTSLANVIHGFWRGSAGILAIRINCLSSDSYATLWKRALSEIGTQNEARRAGFRGTMEKIASTALADFGSPDATADVVRAVLTQLGKQVVVVVFFDEFDALALDVRKEMAETIKLFSDFSVPATLIVVGVAENVSGLIDDHRSVERALVQVHMPRMPAAELRQIVERGLQHLGMMIDPSALIRLTKLALGFPHYAHLLALNSARAALSREMLLIDGQSVSLGISKALEGAQQSLIDAYNLAVQSSQKNHLYKQVLTACARARGDNGWFTPAAVREPLSEIMHKPYDVPSYIRHLNEFAMPHRGAILQRVGAARSYRFRFSNPLMQPYVLLKARSEAIWVD